MKKITIIFFLILLTNTVFGQAILPGPDSLIHYSLELISGNNQHQKVARWLDDELIVEVISTIDQPVDSVPVLFELVTMPEKSGEASIEKELVLTDSLGYASTKVKLGNKDGDYQVMASIAGDGSKDYVLFTLHARKSNWVFMLIIGLLGGLGLFLLGMEMMSEGMKKSAGDKMRAILSSLTSNRLLAVGLGTFVTMIIQSSSATSVMLVGFVNSKLMKFRKTIGILLGAKIGTTITAQLIAFKLTDYSLLLIALGFMLFYFVKKQGFKFVGQAILGFGILFFGMHIMSEAMYPIRSYTPFIELLQTLENPLIGILAGTILTAILQSSSAFIGILIVLAGQGLLSLEAAIPLLLGSNIGTSITAFLASINASREAKKVAMASAFISIFGMILLVAWIPGYAEIIAKISPSAGLSPADTNYMAETVPRQIANAHTVFNVMIAFIILPFTNSLAKFIDWILPERKEEADKEMKTLYLEKRMLDTPVLGLNLAKQEALRVGSIVQNMLSDIILPFITKQDHVLESLKQREEEVDFLSEEVNRYLTQISRKEVDMKTADEAFQIMYTMKELEEIADLTGKVLVKRAYAWIQSKAEFSEEGKKELLEYHILTQKQLSRALEVFKEVNLEKAKRMNNKHSKYRSIAVELEKLHYQRISQPDKVLEESGDTHIDLMTRMRSVTHHATNIGRVILDWAR